MSRKDRSRPPAPPAASSLHRSGNCFIGRFTAMGGPCEILVDSGDHAEANRLLSIARAEAARVEAKFSRYLSGNALHAINTSSGTPQEVDDETAHLLDYAALCHELSGGQFDITSGVLRRVWKFDGGSRVPSSEAVAEVLRNVGWEKVEWRRPRLVLPPGMELDLGGIGKEYAVDRAASLLAAATRRAFLVNFGGDLFASGPRSDGRPWGVGVDDPGRTGEAALYRVDLSRGGLATSGDARRFVLWEGRRLGHILNPLTGWPVEGAPRSITVLAPTCLEAGTLSTLAYLKGPGAEAFLRSHGVEFQIL